MGDEDVLLDTILNGLGRARGRDVFVLNIGAMDGVSFDASRPYVDRFGWRGLFVEPVPELFDRLVSSFEGRHGFLFERAAVTDRDGETEMVRIPPRAVEAGGLDACLLGMSSLLPVRNGFASARERPLLERHGERIRVRSLTLRTLLAMHAVERIDVLHIDAEGYDWQVLRQFDFERYRPAVVRFEVCNLDLDERAAARTYLEANGYEVFPLGDDWAAVAAGTLALDATFVTAVYQRRHDDTVGGRTYPIERYFASLASIVRMRAPLVIYTQPRHVGRVAEFVRRQGADAIVVRRHLASLPRFWDVEEVRVRRRVHTLPCGDRCHVLCFGKFAWLAEQARTNPFGTSRFYWIDAGLSYDALFPARHLPRPSGVCGLFSPAVPNTLRRSPGFVVFALDPIEGQQMHSVGLGEMARIAGDGAAPLRTHVVGGLFGGRRDEVLRLHAEYDDVLADLLRADLLGTEENVLTILYHRDPARFTAQTFTTWYHEDTDFTRPAPHDVSFYRVFERLNAAVVGSDPGVVGSDPALDCNAGV